MVQRSAEAGGDDPGRAGRTTGRRRWTDPRRLVPLVVAASALVVISTAVEGRARVTPLVGPTAPPIPERSPLLEQTARAAPGSNPFAAAIGIVLGTVLLVLGTVLAVVLAVLLIRLIVSAIRNRERRRTPVPIDAAGTVAELRLADAPAVRRGITAVLAAFDDRRAPTNAIVQAWLGLQQTAEDAGFARSPAETPTEFTGRVLSRSSADRDALGTLLRLYLRARFGTGGITAADATAALGALRALEASWDAVPSEDR